jgi:26S proteasome non-ATPase regulatory subunit 10
MPKVRHFYMLTLPIALSNKFTDFAGQVIPPPLFIHSRLTLEQTALHFTASKNNLDITRRLFDAKPPASARVKDKRGQYAIHRAAAVGSAPMVELLLKNKSPINATDVAGQTPLHHAVAEGHGDTAVALLKAGAETDKKDTDGFLALELAPDAQVSELSLEGRKGLTHDYRYGSSSYKVRRERA